VSKANHNEQRRPANNGPRGGGGPAALMPGEKAKNFKASMIKLINYLGKYKWTIFFVMLLAVVSTVFAIIGPKILGKATDELFSGIMNKISGAGGIDFTKIGQIILTLAGLYVISAVLSYLQGFVMVSVTAKVTYKMRNDIFDKMHKLPLKYYDKITFGDVLSRITNDVDTITQTLNQSLSQIITSVTQVLGIIIMMLTISVKLTFVALLAIPLSVAAVMLIVKKSQGHFKNQQKYLGIVNGHVEEMFSSHVIVKAFSAEEDSVKTFDEYNNSLYNSAWKSNFLSGLIMPVTFFIGNLSFVSVCILGGYFTAAGSMTVGGIQAFIQYVRSFSQPVTQIANISNILQQTAAAAERVFEFLDEKEEAKEEQNALSVIKNENEAENALSVYIKDAVSFENVSFGYEPDKIVIKDFNANIKLGQKIAIVGPTGAGKTTIVKLLMRFYDVTSGSIKIGGYDIRDFKRNELRKIFGMVLQDTWLFNGTIADNIRYGKPGASDDEVKRAAKAAQADHFVRTLPDGYNMILNEEANNISQGQKQLLTIARAILADPKILILDEATSSVDTRTEVLIQKAMDNLMQDRTSFIIAHRLSTIQNADLILVINEGDIIEQGTHAQLLAKGGFYANLYRSQFETAG